MRTAVYRNSIGESLKHVSTNDTNKCDVGDSDSMGWSRFATRLDLNIITFMYVYIFVIWIKMPDNGFIINYHEHNISV